MNRKGCFNGRFSKRTIDVSTLLLLRLRGMMESQHETVGDASPRQARGHIGDGCVKWELSLNNVADQTGTLRGRIKRVEMSLKPGFHMIVAVIVSVCRRLIGDTSPMCRSRSPIVTIIWKPG